MASRNNDVQVADFVESEFLGEQVEAINKLSEYVAQLRRIGKGHGQRAVLHNGAKKGAKENLREHNDSDVDEFPWLAGKRITRCGSGKQWFEVNVLAMRGPNGQRKQELVYAELSNNAP
ncbi:ferritin-3, chloroplastic, partial [Tanacetum coccineum]